MFRAIWIGLGLCLLMPGICAGGEGAAGAEPMPWDLVSPETMQELEQMPAEQREKLLGVYDGLSPEEQAIMLDNADELQALSPEEQNWLLENPDTARKLGQIPEGDRQRMLESYRRLSPEMQQAVRKRARGRD